MSVGAAAAPMSLVRRYWRDRTLWTTIADVFVILAALTLPWSRRSIPAPPMLSVLLHPSGPLAYIGPATPIRGSANVGAARHPDATLPNPVRLAERPAETLREGVDEVRVVTHGGLAGKAAALRHGKAPPRKGSSTRRRRWSAARR